MHRAPTSTRHATFSPPSGFNINRDICPEGIVNRLNSFRLASKLFSVFLALLCAAAISAFGQSGSMSPYQGEQDGVSAGGKWMEFHSEDKMTGAKRVRFELLADNYFREDPDYKPRVELMCEDHKLKLGDFNPGVRLPHPNRPGFWGQPQLEVEVRVDNSHSFH